MTKIEKILELVSEYADEKKSKQDWEPGKNWVSYGGHSFDSSEYVAAVKAVLEEWLVFGASARKFEEEFPEKLGKKRGVLTNSGSSANLLMTAALKSKNLFGLPQGSKIITPVVAFPTTVNPIIQNGFEPVFVDVTLPDLNLDLDQVERELQNDDSIKAIMFAHVLGNPPDMDRLMSLIEEYSLIFLEDVCDGLGSTYAGRKLGSFGHISSCSFYPAHHMTMGEGGFVAMNESSIQKTVTSLRDWGRACYCNIGKPGNTLCETACKNRFNNWIPALKDVIYDHRYVYSEIGYNLKPLELQAAIGLQQMKKLESFESARKENFAKLYEVFKPYKEYLYLPEATENSDPVWFAFLLTVRPDAPFDRSEIVSHLESAKIQTRSYFAGNLLYHSAYEAYAAKYEDIKERFPKADLVTRNSFFLGTFIGITDEKIEYIRSVVDEFFMEVQT